MLVVPNRERYVDFLIDPIRLTDEILYTPQVALTHLFLDIYVRCKQRYRSVVYPNLKRFDIRFELVLCDLICEPAQALLPNAMSHQ